MRLSEEQILKNLEFLIEEMNKPCDSEDPFAIAKKLTNLSSIMGLGSKCVGNSEYYYHTNKKSPEYQELRVLSQTVNKDLHYVITSLQSVMNLVKIEYIKTKQF